MEACFLTSNSFTKTLDFITPINSRTTHLSSRKKTLDFITPINSRTTHLSSGKKTISFQSRKTSSLTTCCEMGSNSNSSSPEDDLKPMIDSADWRSFRARLVVDEQASRPDGSIRAPITTGDRWAHKIYTPERGCLLIATEKLDGVHIFERTVILLLSTGPVGPTGIILNRPSLMSIKETRPSSVLDTFSDRPLFFGGPLAKGGVFLLSPSGEEKVGRTGLFEEVVKGLYYGTKESFGCAVELVKRNVVEVDDFRFFDGYCGWEKEQLKDEIKAGYWIVAASSPSVIGLANVGNTGLWDEILGLMGHEKVW